MLKRTRFYLLLALLLPVWLIVGRPLLGSMGWMTVLLLLFAPLYLLPLFTVLLLGLLEPVKASGTLSGKDAFGLGLSILAWFLGGFFLVDGGDTAESMGSVFTIWFTGPPGIETSAIAAAVFGGIGLLVSAVMNFSALARVWKQRRTRT